MSGLSKSTEPIVEIVPPPENRLQALSPTVTARAAAASAATTTRVARGRRSRIAGMQPVFRLGQGPAIHLTHTCAVGITPADLGQRKSSGLSSWDRVAQW